MKRIKTIKIILTFLAFVTLLMVCLVISINASSRFTDVPDNYWAEDDICFCFYQGAFYIGDGPLPTKFYPYAGLTRAVAVDSIRKMLGITIAANANTPFSDVPYSAYYSGSVKWAYDYNITKGTGDGLFSPDTVITRQEYAALIYRALLVENATIPVTAPNVSFTD